MPEFSLGTAALGTAVDLAGLKKGIGDAEGTAKSGFGRVGNVLGGALKVGVAAGAGAVVAAVGAIGVAAFNVSKDTQNAASDMAASLGIPREEAEEFAKVAKEVYGNNFAENIGDAADAVTKLAKEMDLAADDPALRRMTERALAFRDVFEEDVNESVDAANALMQNLGLSGDEAFDFITAGMQRGLNSSDDFLDTIREYSSQFGDAGFSADQMFSILESGSQSGVLGTDKIADSVKEMTLRLNEGGDDVSVAFGAIGLDFDNIAGYVRSGDEAWADYFPRIVEGLNGIEDPIQRSQAQVAIFGTMAEDLGVSFTEGLSASSVAMTDLEGSADSLNVKYESFGDFFSSLWRRAAVALSPLLDRLLELANGALPHIERAFEWFEKTGVPAITKFGQTISEVVAWVMGVFENLRGGLDQTTGTFGIFKSWIDTNMPLIRRTIETILGWIQGFWEAHGQTIMTVVQNTFDTVRTIIDTVMHTVLDLITFVMQLITGDFEGAGETLIGIVTRIWESIKTIFSNQLNSLWTIIRDFGSTMWNAGRELIENLWQGIANRFSGLLDSVRQRLQQLRNLLPGSEPKDSSSPLRGLGDSGQSMIENMQQGIDRAVLNINAPTVGLDGALAGIEAGATGGGGPLSVEQTLNFYGPADPKTVKKAADDGLRSALRRVGRG